MGIAVTVTDAGALKVSLQMATAGSSFDEIAVAAPGPTLSLRWPATASRGPFHLTLSAERRFEDASGDGWIVRELATGGEPIESKVRCEEPGRALQAVAEMWCAACGWPEFSRYSMPEL